MVLSLLSFQSIVPKSPKQSPFSLPGEMHPYKKDAVTGDVIMTSDDAVTCPFQYNIEIDLLDTHLNDVGCDRCVIYASFALKQSVAQLR